MNRSAIVLLLVGLLAACTPPAATNTSGTTSVGAATPRGAVEQFLAAVRAQDLQAMSVIWGTARGPARDQVPRDQLEKRELIMQCFLMHDQARIVRDYPGQDAHRNFVVELTRGPLVRSTTFYTIEGPASRWFVDNVELEPLQDLCVGGGADAP